MYAILSTGGKQYKVQEGDILFIEKLNAEDESIVTFEDILVISDENGLKVGEPKVEGATITAKVIKSGKDKKIMIFKYKSKKTYRNRQGHRQPYTKVQIESIKA